MEERLKGSNYGMLAFDTIENLFNWNKFQNNFGEAQTTSKYELSNFTWNKTEKRPKTLVCHDHRGGYLEYESLQGSTYSNKKSQQQVPIYSFFHWWYVDIFVYFSHHFITVPPQVWILAAHQHGVLILGTFITESSSLFNKCFSDDSIVDRVISSLVDLCKINNFDGWLINIENNVEPSLLDRLEYFLKRLRNELRDKVHNFTQVIWYDSVVNSGKLFWQNELNEDNKRWFSVVDGFYTNYSWEESNLQTTLENFYKNFSVEKSPFDIFIGIDVFGRNCIGGWECDKPMEAIRRYGFSAAIFAPGWICENCPSNDQKISLFDNSERFWNLLKPFLFPHKLTSKQFCTNFSVGFSSECLDFEKYSESEMGRFCMKDLNIQPFYLSSLVFSKDLKPGILIKSGGMLNIFLCNILIEECDQYLKLRYKSTFPIDFVIEISNELKNEHLLAEQINQEGTSNVKSQFLSQKEENHSIIERKLELNLQKRTGWYIKKIILWPNSNSNNNIFKKEKLIENRLFNFEMNLN